jgi:hypothetical protein
VEPQWSGSTPWGANNTIWDLHFCGFVGSPQRNATSYDVSRASSIVKDVYWSIKVAGAPNKPDKQVLLHVYNVHDIFCIDKVVPEILAPVPQVQV